MKSILCGLSLLWACLPAYAQTSYPSRVVTLVNPFAPGASTDVVARIIAQKLSEAWGQTIVVENRPGASGTIGTDHVVHAKPHGSVMLLAALATLRCRD